MQVVPYDPELFGCAVEAWAKERGLFMTRDDLGGEGFVVVSDALPVCAGFVYRTACGKRAFVDDVIADKSAPLGLKLRALHALLARLREALDDSGAVAVFAASAVPSIQAIVAEQGWPVVQKSQIAWAWKPERRA